MIDTCPLCNLPHSAQFGTACSHTRYDLSDEIRRLRADLVNVRGVLAAAHGIVYTKAKADFNAEDVLAQIDKALAATGGHQ